MHDIFYAPYLLDCTRYNAFHHNAGNLALGKLCVPIYFKFPTMHGPQLHRTNRENRCCSLISKWELLLSLCGVLCAAEVFVVTQASDKASCSSWAKSRTSPQGPQVGVGSPAALCARFIIWKHTGRETDGKRNTHTHILKLHISIYWPSGALLNSMAHLHMNIFLVFVLATYYLCALLEGSHFICEFHWMQWSDERWLH